MQVGLRAEWEGPWQRIALSTNIGQFLSSIPGVPVRGEPHRAGSVEVAPGPSQADCEEGTWREGVGGLLFGTRGPWEE